jgi:hypothetical protein
MIQFNIPTKLDGARLIEELDAAGVSVAINLVYGRACPTIHEGFMYLDIEEADKAKAQVVVDAH